MRVFSFLLLLFLLTGSYREVQAIPGMGGMRSSVGNITRNIRHQVRQALKPHLRVLEKEKVPVKNIAITGNKQFVSLLLPHEILLWDLNNSIPLLRQDLGKKTPVSVVMDHEGQFVFILDTQGQLSMVDLTSDDVKIKPLPAGSQAVNAFVYAPSAEALVVTAANRLAEYRLPEFSKQEEVVRPSTDVICCMASHRFFDEQGVIIGQGRKLLFFNVKHLDKPTKSWQMDDDITQLFVSISGKYIAVTTPDKLVMIDFERQQPVWEKTLSEGNVPGGFLKDHFYVVSGKSLRAYSTRWGSESNDEIQGMYGETRSAAVLGSLLLLTSSDGLVYGVNPESGKVLLRWIVTREGWAVVDDRGRFDGIASGVKAIFWSAKKHDLGLAAFSRKYFEPGLLKKVLSGKQSGFITAADNVIEEGVFYPPAIEVKTKESSGVAGEVVTVDVVIRADSKEHLKEVSAVVLYQNGKRLADSRLISKKSEGKQATWRFAVTLSPGFNKISAGQVSWNDIKSYSKPVSIVARADRASKSSLVINSIGINRYATENLLLDYSVDDAKAIAQKFSRQNDAQTINVLILDENAKGSKIRQQLDSLKSLSADDVVVLFLSGHGTAIDGEWYFLPQEARTLEDESHIRRVGLSGREISMALINSPVQKIFFAVDACNSGAVLKDFKMFSQRKSLQQISEDSGVHVLTATRADQLAPEYQQLGHGLFTYVLLHAMTKKNGYYQADIAPRDGKLTVSELKKYVLKFAPLLVRKLNSQFKDLDFDVTVNPVELTTGNDFSLVH